MRFGKLASILSLGAAAFIAGCQSENTPPQSSLVTTNSQAVTCTKCQVTWVKTPVGSGGKQGTVQAYQWSKKDICPDCRNEVDNFFATGKLEHSCKTCGNSMQICENH